MKVLAVAIILALAVATNAVAEIESIEDLGVYNYHMKVGIPRAAEIKKAEEEAAAGRIVGGVLTDISQVPYQAGLVIQILFIFTSVCGGSLISNTRVVTAAHCHSDGSITAQGFTVVLGSSTLFSGGQRIQTNNIAVHPNWTPSTAANDIAVLRINSVSFTNVIQPIALPSGNELNNNFAGQTGRAAGFGLTADGGSINNSQRLSSVNLGIITNAVCANTFGPFVHASNICTSGAGGQSTCQGDSGGPLTVISNGRRILIGATSYGAAAGCSLGFPAAYARITSFASWISAQ